MTIQVNIGDAKTKLSELLQRLEDGERLIIARGNEPRCEVRIIASDRTAARDALARLEALHARGVRQAERNPGLD